MRLLLKIVFFTFLFSCSSPDQNKPVSYDPPGSTDTRDKAITYQIHKTYAFTEDDIYFSNEFPGARLNDVRRNGTLQYEVEISPENAPINDSAWFGFQIWSGKNQNVQITLRYHDGSHRYVPKLSHDRSTWQPIDPARMVIDSSKSSATLILQIGADKLWICAQELIVSDDFQTSMALSSRHVYPEKRAIGTSVGNR